MFLLYNIYIIYIFKKLIINIKYYIYILIIMSDLQNIEDNIKEKLNNHWYKTEHNNLLNNINITNSIIELSTITVEGKLSNVQFNKQEKEIVEQLELKNNIIKIGCNYKELIDDLYITLTTKLKKSNRGRKPKEKVIPNRKIQGTGKYFNSQISFTFLNNIETKKMYHIKLFVNGSIQIPSVTDESLLSINKEVNELINYISKYDMFKEDINKDIEKLYLISIMNNYKTHLIFNDNINVIKDIDHKKNNKEMLINVVEEKKDNKVTINNNLDIESKHKFVIDLYKLEKLLLLYKENDELNKKLNFKIYNINYSPEKYTALVLKFITPIIITDEIILKYKKNINSKKIKKTTIKIFGSAKINLDGSPSKAVTELIMSDLLNIFNEYKNEIFY